MGGGAPSPSSRRAVRRPGARRRAPTWVTVEPGPQLEAELAAATAARDDAMFAHNKALSARTAPRERVHALKVELEQARFAAEPGAPLADLDAAEAIAAARAETEAARASVEQARSEAEAGAFGGDDCA